MWRVNSFSFLSSSIERSETQLIYDYIYGLRKENLPPSEVL